jgi:hypothetical protein
VRASSNHADRDGDRKATEDTKMTQQNIRRHADGSIDIDFYRVQGESERRAATRAFGRGLARLPTIVAALAKGRLCDRDHIVHVPHRLSRLAPDPA